MTYSSQFSLVVNRTKVDNSWSDTLLHNVLLAGIIDTPPSLQYICAEKKNEKMTFKSFRFYITFYSTPNIVNDTSARVSRSACGPNILPVICERLFKFSVIYISKYFSLYFSGLQNRKCEVICFSLSDEIIKIIMSRNFFEKFEQLNCEELPSDIEYSESNQKQITRRVVVPY